MRGRCNNPDDPKYYRYGGRGITVCTRWQDSFENFLKDMGPRPGPGYSIERKNNDGNYTPNNCMWATRRQQQNNTVRNHFLMHAGKTLTVSQWAVELGVPVATLNYRIRAGWPVEKILTQPVGVRCRTRKAD